MVIKRAMTKETLTIKEVKRNADKEISNFTKVVRETIQCISGTEKSIIVVNGHDSKRS